MDVQTTLNFYGCTEEAVQFYGHAIGAETLFMLRFRDCPDRSLVKPGLEEKIFHATFRIGSTVFMASDCGCEKPAPETAFAGFAFALRVETPEKAEQCFKALAEDGRVLIPLAKTFFAVRYGIVMDCFGISWKVMVESNTQNACRCTQLGIALASTFAKTIAMKDAVDWKLPKLPFYLAEIVLIVFGFVIIRFAQNLFPHWQWMALACVSLGVVLGIIPYVYDYYIMRKLIETNALGAVADKIEHLNQFSAQISAATARWAAVQESVGENSEKTAAAARQISDKMGVEVKEFSEFMKKMNDSEKAALRLEVDKLRRSETEWLQMLVRMLDHVFALHAAAARSNQPKVAEQIAQFQNACRGTVRRVGLVSFVGEPNEPFDTERHQLADVKQKPFDGAVIAETVGAGYTFQGKLLRPAMVRLRDANTMPSAITPPPAKPAILDGAHDDLALEEN